MKTNNSRNNFWNFILNILSTFIRKEHLVIYILLTVFIMPWQYFGLGDFLSLKIKEITVILLFFYLFLKCLTTYTIFIDGPGKTYLLFILLSFFYLCLDFLYLDMTFDWRIVSHIFLFTLFNFFIYLIILNLNLNQFDLHNFLIAFKLVYIFFFVYFFLYAYEIHQLKLIRNASFYTVEGELWQSGENIIYMGGSNSKSWFFLVLTSFFVGFYRGTSTSRYLFGYIAILMAITISLLMLSRSAALCSFILFIFYSAFLFKKKIFLVFLVFLTIISMSLISKYSNLNLLKTISSKSSSNARVDLVVESVKFSSNSFFMGRGFHYSAINRDFFRNAEYPALGKNNTQNTYLAILIDIGIIGVFIYLLIWYLWFLKIRRAIWLNPSPEVRYYLSGLKLMIIYIIISGFFHHFNERNFTFMPVYIVIIAIGMKLTHNKSESI